MLVHAFSGADNFRFILSFVPSSDFINTTNPRYLPESMDYSPDLTQAMPGDFKG